MISLSSLKCILSISLVWLFLVLSEFYDRRIKLEFEVDGSIADFSSVFSFFKIQKSEKEIEKVFFIPDFNWPGLLYMAILRNP